MKKEKINALIEEIQVLDVNNISRIVSIIKKVDDERNSMELDHLFNNPEEIKIILANKLIQNFDDLNKKTKKNINVARLIIEAKDFLFNSMPDEIKNNKMLIKYWLSRGCNIYKFLSEEQKNDREILIHVLIKNAFFLNELSEELKNDKELVTRALETNCEAYSYVGNKLKDDRQFLIDIVEKVPNILKIEKKMLKDKELVLSALKSNSYLLEFAKDFQNDKEVVLQAVKGNGDALFYANEELRDDREVVIQAIKQRPRSFIYRGLALWDDIELMFMAVEADGLVIKEIEENIPEYKNLVKVAANENILALMYVSAEYKSKDIILKFRNKIEEHKEYLTDDFDLLQKFIREESLEEIFTKTNVNNTHLKKKSKI